MLKISYDVPAERRIFWVGEKVRFRSLPSPRPLGFELSMVGRVIGPDTVEFSVGQGSWVVVAPATLFEPAWIPQLTYECPAG